MGFLRDLFRPARTGSGGAFNEANERFAGLRHLASDGPRRNAEILHIVALCQDSIRSSRKNGDPHVLLANVMALASVSRRPTDPADADFLLKSAASIMYNWAETPLSQFPFTKNRETAQQLYGMIVDQVGSIFGVSHDAAAEMMSQFHEELGDRPVSAEAQDEYRRAILGT